MSEQDSMWQMMHSQDQEGGASCGPTAKTFNYVVKKVKPTSGNEHQRQEKMTTIPRQEQHKFQSSDLFFAQQHQAQQPLAGVKGIVAKFEHKDDLQMVHLRAPASALLTQQQQQQQQACIPTAIAGETVAKGDSTLPISPKGVEDFDSGSEFFDNYFESETNPFRGESAEERSTASSGGGWDHEMISSGTPKRSNNARISVLKEIGAEDRLPLPPRTQDPSLQDTVTRLFHGNNTISDPNSQAGPATTSIQSAQSPIYTPSISQPPAPLASTGSRGQSDQTVGITGKISSKMRMYIDDYDETFFRALMYKLMCHPKIAKLDIYRSATSATRTPAEMGLLFQMVRSLPKLRILFLTNLHGESDLPSFEESLFRNTNIRSVQLKLASGSVTPGTLRTLQSMACLTEVILESHHSFDASPLIASETLRRLHISSSGTCSFDNAHIMSMVPLLECNSTLEELDLEPKMSLLAFKFLVHALRVNRSLQVVQVATEATSSQALILQAMSEIATVLTMNSTLRVLHNMNYKKLEVDAPCSRWILRGLEANVTAEHFRLFQEDSSFANRKRNLLKPATANLNRSFADGSMYSSNIKPSSRGTSSSFPSGDSSIQGSESSHNTSATTTIFCSAFDITSFNLAPVKQASQSFFQTAREQSERALSYMALGFATSDTKKPKTKSSNQSKSGGGTRGQQSRR